MKILNEILIVGRPIIKSEAFADCMQIRHHKNTTIAQHMINVTVTCLKISNFLESKGFKIDRKRLILASISHDLAMAHAKELYGFSGYFTTAFRHPIDSFKIAQEICDIHKKTSKAITRHMWPLCIVPPNCIEGWILTIADKYIAIQELFHKEKIYEIKKINFLKKPVTSD